VIRPPKWLVALPFAAAALVSAQTPDGNVALGIVFDDVTAAAGIRFVHQSGASPEKRLVETMGSGAAWLDFDNDGFEDLFLVNGAPQSSNALYHNNRDGTFTDATRQAGVAGTASPTSFKTGVAVGDVDNDGDLDLYLTALGPNVLYRNNGNGTFTDITASARVAGGADEWSTSAGFFDADRDGDLDLYVANYLDVRQGDNPYCGLQREGYRMYCPPTHFDGVADRLFRNDGTGVFTDVSAAAGIANPAGKGLGVAFCDVDGDHRTDIFVANDMVRNFLYRNKGDGTFVDITYGAGVGFSQDGRPQAGMGTDCADVNGDGLPDIVVTNFADELNSLYLNRGGGLFDDASSSGDLRSSFTPLGFGTRLFDVDNDGDLDFYVANGHIVDNITLYNPNGKYNQTDQLYENRGDGTFRDVSARGGPAMQLAHVGRGLATADYDNDGDLDVVVTNAGQPPVLLRNRGVPNRTWLTVRLRGRVSNRYGLGARVEIVVAGHKQVAEVTNVSSYQSASDIRVHLGLGSARVIERLEVLWPAGTRQTLEKVGVDQILDIREP
jgi:enediyne biosynthesis protein E4